MEIPDNFYRVSVKALILNDKNEFLLTKEADGFWELLGGGLDFGENPTDGLRREIFEETGLEVVNVAATPAYFFTDKNRNGTWIVNVLYKTTLSNINFKPSNECVELKYFTQASLQGVRVLTNVTKFANLFNPENHE